MDGVERSRGIDVNGGVTIPVLTDELAPPSYYRQTRRAGRFGPRGDFSRIPVRHELELNSELDPERPHRRRPTPVPA